MMTVMFTADNGTHFEKVDYIEPYALLAMKSIRCRKCAQAQQPHTQMHQPRTAVVVRGSCFFCFFFALNIFSARTVVAVAGGGYCISLHVLACGLKNRYFFSWRTLSISIFLCWCLSAIAVLFWLGRFSALGYESETVFV